MRLPQGPFARREDLARKINKRISAVETAAISNLVPQWRKFDVPYTLFTDAATSMQVSIWTMPPKTMALHAVYRSVEAFTGPSLSSATLVIDNFAAADAGPSLGASTGIDVFISPKEDYSATATMYHARLDVITRRDTDVNFNVTLSLAGCNCNQLTGGLAAVHVLTCLYE